MMLRWQLHISAADHAAVQAASKALGISSGEFVRVAIQRMLDEQPN
jgi:hypothetical protein